MSDQPKPSHDDDLVTLATRATEFEAQTLVAVLAEAGIEACAFGAIPAMEPLGQRLTPAVVQVRRSDVQLAEAALKQNVADSVDLDWNEVDVGQMEDDETPTAGEIRRAHEPPSTANMPLVAKIGFGLAVALVLLMLGIFVMLMLKFLP